METILEIAGERIVCKQDGREAFSASLPDFLSALAEQTDHALLPEAIPEGVRLLRRRGGSVVLAIEDKPQLRTVRWLADDSPTPFGDRASYRNARLAFPFVVIIAALKDGALTGYQQCFYRTAPLQKFSDPLFLPNLYNVANGHGQSCWLCLANLKKNLAPLSWEEKVREIRKHMWGAGFNQSSEIHEGNSYWQTMRRIDKRVSSLDAWEEASRQDPFFTLKVNWQPLGKTAGDVMEEMLSATAPPESLASAMDLIRILSLCPRTASRKRTFSF